MADRIIVYDFWAPWCGPCKRFGPTFDRVASNNPDITFEKVNCDEDKAMADSFGVRSIPHVAITIGGDVVYNQKGAVSPGRLQELVDKARAVLARGPQ
jgi:thioredoxin 2